MCVASVDRPPAEMIGHPRRFRALDKRFEALQMIAIQLVGISEVHGNTVLHDRVVFQDLVEDAHRASAIEHVVFGDDFVPIDLRPIFKDVRIVLGAQADSDTQLAEPVEAIGRHYLIRCGEGEKEPE
jgi:hypothetical protein